MPLWISVGWQSWGSTRSIASPEQCWAKMLKMEVQSRHIPSCFSSNCIENCPLHAPSKSVFFFEYLHFRPRLFFPEPREPRHKRTCAWLCFPGVGAQCQGPTGRASNFKGLFSMCFHWFLGTTRLTSAPKKCHPHKSAYSGVSTCLTWAAKVPLQVNYGKSCQIIINSVNQCKSSTHGNMSRR